MNDRLTLDNAQQKNNSGSKKSKLAKLKQEALAKIDSVVAVVEKCDETGGCVHKERPESDFKRIFCNPSVEPENSSFKMRHPLLVAEMQDDNNQGCSLGDDCGPGGSLDAQSEPKDEDWIQNSVENDSEQGQHHRFARISG